MRDKALVSPYDVTFDTSGNLYVANFGDDDIREFNSPGTDLGAFASAGFETQAAYLAFAPVPEPTSGLLLMLGGSVVGPFLLLRRQLPKYKK